EKLFTLEKNKGVDLECTKCKLLRIENEKLKEEAIKLNFFKKSIHCLNEMLSNQKPSRDKLGLGFNSFEASTSGTKEIKFVKSQKETSPGRGPLNKGDPHIAEATPKVIMGPSVFSTWMVFGGNTHDLGSFEEETDKITDLHQIFEEVLFTEREDGVTGIKRRRRDLSNDGIRDLAMASGCGRLKEDIKSST
nr:hypothetical protein [Tanacetum cinerariifolium]